MHQTGTATKTGQRYWDSRADAMKGWAYIIKALVTSDSPDDRKLAEHVARFVRGAPFVQEVMRQRQREAAPPFRQRTEPPQPTHRTTPDRPGPEFER